MMSEDQLPSLLGFVEREGNFSNEHLRAKRAILIDYTTDKRYRKLFF